MRRTRGSWLEKVIHWLWKAHGYCPECSIALAMSMRYSRYPRTRSDSNYEIYRYEQPV